MDRIHKFSESLSLRISTEGLWVTLLRPAISSTLGWTLTFAVLLALGQNKREMSPSTVLLFLILATTFGVLSTLARSFWGRELQISEHGHVTILGQRTFVASGTLRNMSTPIVSLGSKQGEYVIEFRFPQRSGEKTVLFTTRCMTGDAKDKLFELLGCNDLTPSRRGKSKRFA